jgi:hypothetical protein
LKGVSSYTIVIGDNKRGIFSGSFCISERRKPEHSSSERILYYLMKAMPLH